MQKWDGNLEGFPEKKTVHSLEQLVFFLDEVGWVFGKCILVSTRLHPKLLGGAALHW